MKKKIVVRAYYKGRPKIGYIHISQISGLDPKEYKLVLWDELNGPINSSRVLFPTATAAIAHASLYGFLTNNWEIKEKTIES